MNDSLLASVAMMLAEGRLSVEEATKLLNTAARYQERVNDPSIRIDSVESDAKLMVSPSTSKPH